MESMVSLSHYDGLNGFGQASQTELDELRKALSAGYAITNQTGGSAMRVESLEQSLKVVTYSNKHIVLWRKINKTPAYSTVEEYNQLLSYGATDRGAFTREGELPQSSDTSYARRTALVKYLGTTREVTHPMTLVNPAHGDVIAMENQAGILWLLERLEDSLFHGDAALAFDGEAEQFDGLDSLIDPSAYVDLEGGAMTEDAIEQASNQVYENYGYPSDLFAGPKPLSDLVKQFYPRHRVSLPAPQDGTIGQSINSMATQAGLIQFNPNLFLRKTKNPPAAATSPSAPVAAGALAASDSGVADSAEWAKQLGTVTANQTFTWAVTMCNRFGESAPIYDTLAVPQASINADNAVNLQVTLAAALGPNPPEFIRVYRSLPGVTTTTPADLYEVQKVPVTSQTAAVAMVAVAVDRNFILPNTYTAYLGELSPQVLTFRQLAPMMKLDLAVLAPAYRWMVLMYGVPVLYTPLKWTRLINVGDLT